MTQNVAVRRTPAGVTKLFLMRAERGLRQVDLAEQTGIHSSRISRIETGRAWPRDHEIEALTKVFDLKFIEICELAREARQAARAEGASV